MVDFADPFPPHIPQNNEICGGTGCAPATGCFECGYEVGACGASGCATLFSGMSTTFLGGFVTGFSSKLGFGSSESTLNVDLVLYKDCPTGAPIGSNNGVCCDPAGQCSTWHKDDQECQDAGGTWMAGVSCDTDPCNCINVLPTCLAMTYIGQLGYIYHFCMGKFIFRGILTNHTYSEGSDGFRYRATLTDGRSIMGLTAVILNEIYSRPPVPLEHGVINVLYSQEPSVEDCQGEKKCKDFMKSGANKKGILLQKALEGINNKQIQVPVSDICLRIDVSRLIPLVSPVYRTNTIETSVLELINLACEESGHDFFCTIEIKDEWDDATNAPDASKSRNYIIIHPISYKEPPPPSGLFQFIENLAAKNSVISREYGQEMTFEKNKKLVFGDNYHYLTVVTDNSQNSDHSGSSTTSNCSLKNSPSNRKVAVDNIAAINAITPSSGCTPP